MSVRITIEVDGQEFPLTEAGIDAAEQAAHIASGLPAASPESLQGIAGHNRAQLLAALEAAHKRDHELVRRLAQAEEAIREQNDLLRQRTVERDHFKEDSLLWSLVVAYFVDEAGGELQLDREAINAYMGKMLDANVRDGQLYITLEERPEASQEGANG